MAIDGIFIGYGVGISCLKLLKILKIDFTNLCKHDAIDKINQYLDKNPYNGIKMNVIEQSNCCVDFGFSKIFVDPPLSDTDDTIDSDADADDTIGTDDDTISTDDENDSDPKKFGNVYFGMFVNITCDWVCQC